MTGKIGGNADLSDNGREVIAIDMWHIGLIKLFL